MGAIPAKKRAPAKATKAAPKPTTPTEVDTVTDTEQQPNAEVPPTPEVLYAAALISGRTPEEAQAIVDAARADPGGPAWPVSAEDVYAAAIAGGYSEDAARNLADRRAAELAASTVEQPADEPADEGEPDEAPASAGLQFDQLEHCPTPGLCFPYGLAADTSHAACIHGETHAAETS